MSDVARLKAQVEAAQLELKLAEDAEFCSPENIREVLLSLAKSGGGLSGDTNAMTLQELAEALRKDISSTYNAYQASLWPKSSRTC